MRDKERSVRQGEVCKAKTGNDLGEDEELKNFPIRMFAGHSVF